MLSRSFAVASIAAALAALHPVAAAQESTPDTDPTIVTSSGSVSIAGRVVAYEARTGTLTINDDDGEPLAHVFHIAYSRTSNAAEDRPITFVFNGGPGSSSIWLHMGLFGPYRVDYADDFGNPGAPPYDTVPNELSLLDKTDLVFIDPVSTGYSRPVEGVEKSEFHGVEEDLDSIAEFIRLYLGEHERWGSPIFLAGESYGTFRAAGLAAELWNDHHIATRGVVLVSAVLDMLTIRYLDGHDLPYPLILPTYVATAHFHDALPPRNQDRPLRDVLRDAERFATTDYALALMQGARLSEDQEADIARRLGEFTGLDPEFILDSNLRVPLSAFAKELLRERGLTVGRLDSRFTGQDRDDAGDSYEYDPSYGAIRGVYTAAFNRYVREDLGYKTDADYRVLTGEVRPWSYGTGSGLGITNLGERLRSAMHQQPYMNVFVASGYYDAATPYFAADYTVDHLQLRPELRDNVRVRYYEAGHMMYVHRPDLEKLRGDLAAFYDETLRDRRGR
ncbi:MAG: peptidase S10 [Planctomycetota bacterium]